MIPKRYLVVCATFLLAACSRGPSDADLRQAMHRTTGMGGKQGADNKLFKDVKVLDCEKESSGKAYRCNVTGLFGAQTMRLIRDDKGWMLIH